MTAKIRHVREGMLMCGERCEPFRSTERCEARTKWEPRNCERRPAGAV